MKPLNGTDEPCPVVLCLGWHLRSFDYHLSGLLQPATTADSSWLCPREAGLRM